MGQELRGGCQCGQVRYRYVGDRPAVYVCHCAECQKQSASAFGMSLPVDIDDLTIEGMTESWERGTDRGSRSTAFFCPECGSRVYHQSSRTPEWVNLRGGTLDDTSWLTPAAHIYVSRKQPWVVIDPQVPAHETQPDNMVAWLRSAAAAQ